MDQMDSPGFVAHAADEIQQILLIGVRRIATQRVNARNNFV